MSELASLLENNRQWAARMTAAEPGFFHRLAHQQTPKYLWIGCSDSRVPANEIVGLAPGEMFVHRNVANVVVHTDLNCLSVLQYAVEVLHVRHIMVVGHYGCGGIEAAGANMHLGLIDNWLRHVQDVARKHRDFLATFTDPAERARKLCELNAIEQAVNLCETTIIEGAWQRGAELTAHALVYGLRDGLLKPLHFAPSSLDEITTKYKTAIENLYAVK